MKLPKELKKLRATMRLVFGRGRYDEAHEYAARVYSYKLAERRQVGRSAGKEVR